MVLMCPDRLYQYRPTTVEGNTLLHRRGQREGERTSAVASRGSALPWLGAKVFLFGGVVS